jgi:hypothetical protein
MQQLLCDLSFTISLHVERLTYAGRLRARQMVSLTYQG